MKIGLTDCGDKYQIYEKWILSQNSSVSTQHIEVIKLGYKHNNLHEIEQCDGIVLTGGEDVHPSLYNRPEFLSLCNPNFMDERRDEFEWKVCEHIFKKQTPVLGICRGLQLVNVFLGGTLIPDILTAGKENHSKYYEGQDRYHSIEILHDSELSKITNIVYGDVNSAHHQSANIIAKPLKINALSDDRVVEGLELDSAVGFDFAHPTEPGSVAERNRSHFLMLVQWHPERIINAEQNNFSYKIRQTFVEHSQIKIQ